MEQRNMFSAPLCSTYTHKNTHVLPQKALRLTHVPSTSLLGQPMVRAIRARPVKRQKKSPRNPFWFSDNPRIAIALLGQFAVAGWAREGIYTAAVYKPTGKEKTSLCELGADIWAQPNIALSGKSIKPSLRLFNKRASFILIFFKMKGNAFMKFVARSAD